MKHLMIGPGGIYFYSLFGLMCRLNKDGHLRNLKEISGSSAGSLTAFLYLMGKDSLDKVKEYIFSCEYGDTFKMHPMRLIKKYGLIDTMAGRNFLSTLCSRVFGIPDITFEQLYQRTNIVLHISSLSLLKNDVEYFSVHTHPTLSVLDAVCMSISAPFVFTPFKNHIDAGVIELVPYAPFIGKDDVVSIINEQDMYNPSKNSIFSHLFHVLNLISRLRKDESFSTRIIIPSFDKGVFDFKQSPSDRMKLFVHGYNITPNLPSPVEIDGEIQVGQDISDQSESCTGQVAKQIGEHRTSQYNLVHSCVSETLVVVQSAEDTLPENIEAPSELHGTCDSTLESASESTHGSGYEAENESMDKSTFDRT